MQKEGLNAPPLESTRGDRAAADAALARVLESHQNWVASGWETGRRADLHGRDLRGSKLCGVVLSDADLHHADFRRAALSDADLDGADLHGTVLQHADLRGALLQWADLHRADLQGADLQKADLRHADLHGADLRGADLTAAALEDADLRGADLRGTRGLISAQLALARLDATTRLPRHLQLA